LGRCSGSFPLSFLFSRHPNVRALVFFLFSQREVFPHPRPGIVEPCTPVSPFLPGSPPSNPQRRASFLFLEQKGGGVSFWGVVFFWGVWCVFLFGIFFFFFLGVPPLPTFTLLLWKSFPQQSHLFPFPSLLRLREEARGDSSSVFSPPQAQIFSIERVKGIVFFFSEKNRGCRSGVRVSSTGFVSFSPSFSRGASCPNASASPISSFFERIGLASPLFSPGFVRAGENRSPTLPLFFFPPLTPFRPQVGCGPFLPTGDPSPARSRRAGRICAFFFGESLLKELATLLFFD